MCYDHPMSDTSEPSRDAIPIKPQQTDAMTNLQFADSALEQSGFEPLVPLPSRIGAEPYRPAFDALRGGKQERSSMRRGMRAATPYIPGGPR